MRSWESTGRGLATGQAGRGRAWKRELGCGLGVDWRRVEAGRALVYFGVKKGFS